MAPLNVTAAEASVLVDEMNRLNAVLEGLHIFREVSAEAAALVLARMAAFAACHSERLGWDSLQRVAYEAYELAAAIYRRVS